MLRSIDRPALLGPLIPGQALGLPTLDLVLLGPVPQRFAADPRSRATWATDLPLSPYDSDRPFTELRIELASFPGHGIPYSPCIHELGGTSISPVPPNHACAVPPSISSNWTDGSVPFDYRASPGNSSTERHEE